MAYLKDKIKDLEKAILAWQRVLNDPFTDVVRDASIQRYEFTFELFWKVLKLYLKEEEGIECFSPKSCIREIRPFFKLSDAEIELCLKMSNDRNISVHTYSEKMANALFSKLENYLKITEKILKQIKVTII